MFNLTKKENLSTDEQRTLHMLHFDGEKRFSVTFPDDTIKNTEEFVDALLRIGKHYKNLVKRRPELITVLDVNDTCNQQYEIYDNLAQEYFNINLSDLNRFLLLGKILKTTDTKGENYVD